MRYINIPLLLLFFFSSKILNAQFFENNSVYISNEFLLGNHLGIDIAVNWINKKNFSFQTGYSGHISPAKSRPDDYSGGTLTVFTLGTDSPSDKFNTLFIKAGRVFPMNTKETIRLNLMGGIGITSFREATNWQKTTGNNQGGFFSGPNYTFEYENHTLISVLINPKIEFPLGHIFGLSISPLAEINSERVVWGLGVGVIVGAIKIKK